MAGAGNAYNGWALRDAPAAERSGGSAGGDDEQQQSAHEPGRHSSSAIDRCEEQRQPQEQALGLEPSWVCDFDDALERHFGSATARGARCRVVVVCPSLCACGVNGWLLCCGVGGQLL